MGEGPRAIIAAFAAGRLDRRSFISCMTSLGVSAGLAGMLADGTRAQATVDEGLTTPVEDPGMKSSTQSLDVRDHSTSGAHWIGSPVLVSSWPPYRLDNSGDNDVTAGLQMFLEDVSRTGLPGILAPGMYRLDGIVDVRSNTRLSMYGAELLCFNPELGSPGYSNSVPVLRLRNCQDVSISGGTISGRDSTANFANTEHKHGIAIEGGKSISLTDLRLVDCSGDGVYVEPYRGSATTEFSMQSVRCDGNHRQGMSILAMQSGRMVDCSYTGTTGTNPQSGVDIEPEEASSVVRDIWFERCHFDSNAGSGFVVSLVPGAAVQGEITVVNSTIRGNTQWGVWLAHTRDTSFRNCVIEENGTHGVWMLGGDNAWWTMEDCILRRNGHHGVVVGGTDNSVSLTSARITNCLIYGNSANAPGMFNGIRLGLEENLHLDDLVIATNTIGRHSESGHVSGIAFGPQLQASDVQILRNNLRQGNGLPFFDHAFDVPGLAEGTIGDGNLF